MPRRIQVAGLGAWSEEGGSVRLSQLRQRAWRVVYQRELEKVAAHVGFPAARLRRELLAEYSEYVDEWEPDINPPSPPAPVPYVTPIPPSPPPVAEPEKSSPQVRKRRRRPLEKPLPLITGKRRRQVRAKAKVYQVDTPDTIWNFPTRCGHGGQARGARVYEVDSTRPRRWRTVVFYSCDHRCREEREGETYPDRLRRDDGRTISWLD